MDPARMFKESLTSRPELENSQGQKLPNWARLQTSSLPLWLTCTDTPPTETIGQKRSFNHFICKRQ